MRALAQRAYIGQHAGGQGIRCLSLLGSAESKVAGIAAALADKTGGHGDDRIMMVTKTPAPKVRACVVCCC